MEEIWTLLFLSAAMFTGCYVAGLIPLVLTLSEVLLRRVTTFGAGLLVGTALTVIIPEGVECLLERTHGHHDIPDSAVDTRGEAVVPAPPSSQNNPPSLSTTLSVQSIVDKNGPIAMVAQSVKESSSEYSEHQLLFFLGLSLLLGFVFMLLIDQLMGSSHSHSGPIVPDNETRPKRNLTATIGLVVHAAADGLALGAAAGLSRSDVELVIFVAIMLHKAPAAFGFTSFLMHEGYDKRTAKVHLLVFALAAPVSAFVAYFGLVRIMYVIHAPITGIAMLFSAGTFLYVATVHVLTELTNQSEHSKLSRQELLILVLGALLPLLFNVIHSH